MATNPVLAVCAFFSRMCAYFAESENILCAVNKVVSLVYGDIQNTTYAIIFLLKSATYVQISNCRGLQVY